MISCGRNMGDVRSADVSTGRLTETSKADFLSGRAKLRLLLELLELTGSLDAARKPTDLDKDGKE